MIPLLGLLLMNLMLFSKHGKKKREAEEQDEWNMIRLLATITLSPHCKNKIHPEKLLPRLWDKAQKKPAEQAGVKTLSREERRERIRN